MTIPEVVTVLAVLGAIVTIDKGGETLLRWYRWTGDRWHILRLWNFERTQRALREQQRRDALGLNGDAGRKRHDQRRLEAFMRDEDE